MYYNEDKLIALNRKLLDAVENSNDVIVTDLLNQTIKTIVNSAAELAEEKGHVNVLKELLVQEVADKDKYLYRAVKKGFTEIVKLLLNQGVSTEYVIDRLTSIQLAIILKRTEIVKLLLDAGAKLYHDDTYDNAIIIAEAYNKDPVQKKIHKLVMDEYYKRIGRLNLNPNNGKSFTVVIARYNEDLSWIAKEFPTEQVIIYNKGSNDIGDLPDNCLVVNLPNIGRETHSYLYHIISNYNNLSDRILFIQGQPYDHRIYLPLVKHKVITDSSCKNTIAKCMYDSLANQSDGLEQENWQDSKWKDIVLSNKTMLEFTKYYIGQQYFGDTEIYFQWGGQFAVDKEKILCHEKKYFENLIATLNEQYPIEGHYIERLWDLIFSCESSPTKSMEIVREKEISIESSNDVIVTDLLNQTIKTIVNSDVDLTEEKGHVNVLRELLVQEIADKDKYLYQAVKKNFIEIVKLLLNQGVSTEYAMDRLTSIQLAIILKRTEIVKLLLDAGANIFDNAVMVAEIYNEGPIQKEIHRLVMDEYYKRIEKLDLSPDNGKSFTVVIARYDEDLSWIAKEFPTEQVIIYNKGPDYSGELPDNCKIIKLPNIGRETHSYFHHIISNYNNLADRILFIQGKPYDHKIYLPLIKNKISNETLCQNTIGPCVHDSLENQSSYLIKVDWQDSKWKDIVLSNKTMLEFTKYYIGQQYFGDTEIYFQWGGQFAVDKEKILCHEKKYFENLIATLNKQHPIEVHYIERLWDLIFSCESSPTKSMEIVREKELSIPKIIHRIWMVWNPDKPEIIPIYQEFDRILKNLHPDWQFMEWDDKKVLKFISDFYPDFLPTYLAYDVPVKRHDACRYFILDHFGGAFIQHSFKFQKNIEPLISNTDLVLTTDTKAGTSITNGFLASIPGHELWKTCIKQLVNTASLSTLDATGPRFLAKTLGTYVANNGEESLRILSRDYLLPFDWEEKFDPIINKNCIEDHSKCFELFPNAYSFSLWNLESRNNDLKQTYKVYVINLDKSVERWKKISTDLDEVGIKYERFSAINGNQVKLRNILTQEEFSGLDIKNKIAKIEKSVMYEVTCNPDDNNPTIFNYLGSFNHIKKGLSAGELGIWCSNIIIWKDIAKNNYKNAIILEDDVIIKKDIFKQGVHNFVTNVPKTFDIAYLDIHQYKGKQFPLVGNEYVNRFSDKSGGWGAWSILYNEKVINKLLALECYSYTVDDFFWSIITNKHYKKPECVDNSITLEVYTSSKDILDVSGNGSVICEMGRDFWQC